MIRILCLITALALLMPAPLAASSYGSESGDNQDLTGGQLLSDRLTNRVISILVNDFRRCTGIDRYYRTDCYKHVFRRAWRAIAGNRAYRTAESALKKVDQTISAYVSENVDRSKPVKLRGGQIYRPIKPEAEPRAKKIVADAMDQAETTLLRSPDNTGDHYVRIASAINSNKVLLRSTLRWLGRLLRIA